MPPRRNVENGTGGRNGTRQSPNQAARGGRRKAVLLDLVRFLVFAVAIYLVLIAGSAPLGVRRGMPSPRDFKARVPFTSVDIEQTRAAREWASRMAPPVLRPAPHRWRDGAQQLLAGIRQGDKSLLWQSLPESFDLAAFRKTMPHLQKRQRHIEDALRTLMKENLVAPATLTDPLVQEKLVRHVIIRDPSGAEQKTPVVVLVPLVADTPQFEEAFAPALDGLSPGEAALAKQAFALVLQPTMELDREQSLENQASATAKALEVRKQVEKGHPILAKGTEVQRQHEEDLRRENVQFWVSGAGRIMLAERLGGLALTLLIVMAGATIYIKRYQPELWRRRPPFLSFLLLTLALTAAGRLCVIWGLTPLIVPVPLMVMVICLVYDQRFGLGVALFYAALVRLACPGADREFLVLLAGGIMAALLTGKVRTRSTLIKAGALTGLIQLLGVWGLGLAAAMDGELVPMRFWDSPLFPQSLAALGNGVLSGFIVSGILPAIERLFGVTTDIRLLEWSDPNQLLLQRLLLDAPGSYHHSMVVGTLAADCAEAIGANPLLARVSAYFHDVGKLKKPEYFGENLPAGAKNPHDELSSTMSRLIITAHPKDGAEMAEEYNLPKEVRDIILQSHGSSVVKYFWGKSQEEGREPQEVGEHDFRYRLPKPQSKEAAIVMACDAVESAARSLNSPSGGQIQGLVHEIIIDRLHDGQLDESGLTVTDLKRIEDCLVRGLGAVFHNRISYPGQEKLEKEPAAAAGSSEEAETDAAGSE